MDPATFMQWENLAGLAISLGVKSFSTIKAMMSDAGADDAAIAALQPKWDALVDDIRRAGQ